MTKPVYSDLAKKIMLYLRFNKGKSMTCKLIAEDLDENPRAVNCAVTALSKKGLVRRYTDPLGSKAVEVTENGMTEDLDAERE